MGVKSHTSKSCKICVIRCEHGWQCLVCGKHPTNVRIWSSPFPSCPVSACSGVLVVFGLWLPALQLDVMLVSSPFSSPHPFFKPQSVHWQHLEASESSQLYPSERSIWVSWKKCFDVFLFHSKNYNSLRRGRNSCGKQFPVLFLQSQHHFLVLLGPCPPQLTVLRRSSAKDLSAPRRAAATLRMTWRTQGKSTSRPRATLSVNPSIWLCPMVRSQEGLASAGQVFLPFPKVLLSAPQPTQEGAPWNWPGDEISSTPSSAQEARVPSVLGPREVVPYSQPVVKVTWPLRERLEWSVVGSTEGAPKEGSGSHSALALDRRLADPPKSSLAYIWGRPSGSALPGLARLATDPGHLLPRWLSPGSPWT